MFKNFRIKKRLTVSFIIISVIASISGIVGGVAMFYIAGQYDYALQNYGFSQGDVGKALTTFAETRSATRAVIGYTDDKLIKDVMDIHNQKKADCQQYMEAIKDTLTTDKEVATYESALIAMEKFWKIDEEILELGNTSDVQRSAQAQARTSTELTPAYDEAYSYLAELMSLNVNTGNEMQKSLAVLRNILFIVIIAAILIALILSVIFGNNIAKGIANPLRNLSNRLKTFADGVLSEEFPQVDRQDEVSDMINVAKSMAENLTFIIQDAKYCLSSMADGDYTVESKMVEKYVGEFSDLNTSIRQMNVNMNRTLKQIEEASDQVSSGATNLAQASQNLAEGATEQAGAVEELLATVTDITEGINQTSKQVEQAYEMSREYAIKAGDSSKEMQTMLSTMQTINNTSKKIENIIAEIEEIASQTNLLSLNASIEAARAGEAGRGFAVVADQIGKLADESAQSAVNTRNLIMSAISEINIGTQVAGKTADILEEVVKGIKSIAASSKNVSELAVAQAESMKQAESGINQISEVIQSNSATAQQSSATSEELSAEAVSLDELIKHFKLKEA